MTHERASKDLVAQVGILDIYSGCATTERMRQFTLIAFVGCLALASLQTASIWKSQPSGQIRFKQDPLNDSVVLYATDQLLSASLDAETAGELFKSNSQIGIRSVSRAPRELLEAKAAGMVVTVPRSVRASLLERKAFASPVSDKFRIDGVRVRLEDGGHAGAEGWAKASEIVDEPKAAIR